jgi:hypothetical protein
VTRGTEALANARTNLAHERDPVITAQLDEARTLQRRGAIEHTAEDLRLVGHDAGGPTGEVSETGHEIGRPPRRHLEQIAAVHDRSYDAPDVVHPAGRGRHIAVRTSRGRLNPAHGRRMLTCPLGQISQQQPGERRGIGLINCHEVAHAVARVNPRTSESLRGDVLAQGLVDHSRPRQEHVRALDHDHEVGERRRVAATAGRGAGDDRNLRHLPRKRHVLIEDATVGAKCVRSLLQACAGRLDERDHRHAEVTAASKHLHHHCGLRFPYRTAGDRAVLRVGQNWSTLDPPAGG